MGSISIQKNLPRRNTLAYFYPVSLLKKKLYNLVKIKYPCLKNDFKMFCKDVRMKCRNIVSDIDIVKVKHPCLKMIINYHKKFCEYSQYGINKLLTNFS